ncbi:MAG: efflux RND transporter permease subunit [Myxococcales bacterium]|nr:efflux RND transporter permease subunit [Myxococcales bacterium]
MRAWTDRFVERPVLAVVLSLLLVLLGMLGFSRLGVRETPDIESPVVTVSTVWPGADPAIVESDVTELLEREINGIEGVRTLTSSSQDGRSEITVEFDAGRDLEAAANDVRSRVGRVRGRLPRDVLDPGIDKADGAGSSMMFLRLAGESGDLLAITDVADSIVRERIENVAGVSSVEIMGARVYAMRVELDAGKMAARGVTVSDVERALAAGNVDVPAGRLEGAATQLTVRLAAGLSTPEEFQALVVRGGPDGRVYLRDIATVRLGAENERTSARADGVASVSLAVNPQTRASVVAISDEIQRRLPEIAEALPDGYSLDIVFDRAFSVRDSIEEVQLTLGVAFLLVVLVIFGFLRDIRSTVVPAIAIPVSLLGTFLVLWLAGFTINVFTLFGLVLAIGLVVDDAIVVLENIVRHLEAGVPPVQAALDGTRQITTAVVVTTLSLLVVFIPIMFTGGSTGRLFLEFGLTVAASVALSMVVALTLTPMLTAALVRPSRAPRGEGSLQRAFSASFAWVERRPMLVVPVLLLAGGLGAVAWRALPSEFFPLEDRNNFVLRLEAQEGTSFEWMDARVREFEAQIIPLVPERRVALARVGTGRGGTAAGPNTGMLFFSLVPKEERTRSQMEIVTALKPVLAKVTSFRVVPIQTPTAGRGFSTPLQFVLQHPEFDTLAAELPRFLAAARQVPGLATVNEDLRLDRPELALSVDREKAAAVGVPLSDIARSLQVLTAGAELGRFKRGVRQYPVIAQLGRADRDEPADLSRVALRSVDGALVPLTNLVSGKERTAAATRFHYGRSPSATISANLDGITLGQGVQRLQALAREQLPSGFHTALAGQAKELVEGSASLVEVFGLALLFVYLLLAAQFNSWVAPISVMLTVPLALGGALGALWFFGQSISFFSQIALILLVGLVTKNGILIVEYARQAEADRGLGPWEAAAEAARLRFRPILMTSVATIGGALPIALGLSGAGRAALGIAVVAGMITATGLTLYVTPIAYAVLASVGRTKRG